jgi:hypothetical protein
MSLPDMSLSRTPMIISFWSELWNWEGWRQVWEFGINSNFAFHQYSTSSSPRSNSHPSSSTGHQRYQSSRPTIDWRWYDSRRYWHNIFRIIEYDSTDMTLKRGVLGLSLLSLLITWIIYNEFSKDLAVSGTWGCEMSWMTPSYVEIPWKDSPMKRYRLFWYREQGWDNEVQVRRTCDSVVWKAYESLAEWSASHLHPW